MDEYIKKSELVAELKDAFAAGLIGTEEDVLTLIGSLPAADVESLDEDDVQMTEWLRHNGFQDFSAFEEAWEQMKNCPYCRAKMDLKEGEENA